MIKVRKVHPDAKLPVRANANDAGLDLFSVENVTIKPLSRAIVDTGIQIQITDGSEKFDLYLRDASSEYFDHRYARIAPRSGLAAKNGVDTFAGVVDSGYRNNVKVILFNSSSEQDFVVNVGDKIAQMVIEKIEIHDAVWDDNLDNSERGEKGFGSSDEKK